MLVLIAESKAMNECQAEVSTSEFAAHTPMFEDDAAEIITHLRDIDTAVMASAFKLGPQNVARLRRSLDEFSDKRHGIAAIDAFTGVVFRSLDPSSLDAAVLARDVIIISSLYGLLRPYDIVKPYRLDYMMKAAPGGKMLAAWWKERVTRVLADMASRHHQVLNLLPTDAAKCFDHKAIEKVAEVYDVDLREYGSGGALKHPSSESLKRLRGSLLRHIIANDITSVEQLRRNMPADMLPADSDSLTFVTA